MPAKEAEESLLEGPIGPVITQNVLVVLHVFRQLPKRHKRVAFRSVTVEAVLLHGIFGLFKRKGFISFSGFALHHAFGLNSVHWAWERNLYGMVREECEECDEKR